MSLAKTSVDEMVAMLGDERLAWDAQLGIVEALVARGEAAFHPLLAAFTEGADSQLRGFAALALGRLGDRRAVDPLLRALGGPGHIADEIGQALAPFGAVVFPRLMAAFQTGEAGVRQDAALALGYLGDARAVEPLVAALRDREDGVRWYGARALGLLRDIRAVEPLLAALTGATLTFDEEVRYAAIEALGKLGDRRAVPAILGSLSDPEAYIHSVSATALGAIGDPQVIPFLIRLLGDVDEHTNVAHDIATALGQMGEPAIAPLLTALGHSGGDGDVRAGIVWALGNFNDGRVVQALEQIRVGDTTRTRDGRKVAEMAAYALRNIEDGAGASRGDNE